MSSPTPPFPTEVTIEAPLRGLLAACLRDYATLLIKQQSLRPIPAEVHRAYERVYGSPLHVETLAEDLRVLASTFDIADG